ncbi:MAG: hypothetical protein Q9219_007208 [cf. Caloplaca sp. 3 TL-2023]
MALTMTPEAFASTRFDYLIAGGGTAGLVLANRLTEIPTVSVGVIEAGMDMTDDVKVRTPLYMFDMQGNPNYDWNMSSEPQEALDGLRVAQARGKMLGGSSGINFMQLTFASRADLNDWEVLGNTGWNYETMKPYYEKFENFQAPSPEVESLGITGFVNEAVHGHGGPINATLTPFYTPMQTAWTPTLANMGLAPNGDPRDGVSLGGYNNPMVLSRGTSQRSFAGNSYWKPYATRPNLHTVTKAVVHNIVFSEDRSQGLIATGLNFTANNQTFIANAQKEVIVSGGTMKSPQMLELSGIGDAQLLGSFGIVNLVDNPNVGENLQDHPQCGVPFVPKKGDLTFDDAWDEERNAFWTKLFETNGTGVLAGGVSDTAQLSWSQILGPEKKNRPTELVARYYNSSEGRPGLKAQLDLTAKKLIDPNESAIQTSGTSGGGRPLPGQENKNAFIGGFVTHPFSRGYVHIKSTDPNEDPKFDPRYLSHPLDYEVLKDLQYFSLNISTTAPMSNHLEGNGTTLAPPLTEINDETVRDLINTGFITGWHVVGSCAMMPRAQGGVVDPRLKVYGTKNVRVVDASIVPLHVRGNTVSLVYAIAEKAADIIKQDMNGTVVGSPAGGPQAFEGAAGLVAVDPFVLMLLVWLAVFFLV